MNAKLMAVLVVAATAGLCVPATAEETAKDTVKEAAKPAKTETPLKLQIVLSRHLGEKLIASLPYSLALSSDAPAARLRAGIQVPLKFEGKDYPGNIVYKSVGTELDCSVKTLEGGRFSVVCDIELGSVFSTNGDQGGTGHCAAPPVLRNFAYKATLTLRDGQTAQYVSAADPLSGEVHQAEITLRVIK